MIEREKMIRGIAASLAEHPAVEFAYYCFPDPSWRVSIIFGLRMEQPANCGPVDIDGIGRIALHRHGITRFDATHLGYGGPVSNAFVGEAIALRWYV